RRRKTKTRRVFARLSDEFVALLPIATERVQSWSAGIDGDFGRLAQLDLVGAIDRVLEIGPGRASGADAALHVQREKRDTSGMLAAAHGDRIDFARGGFTCFLRRSASAHLLDDKKAAADTDDL